MMHKLKAIRSVSRVGTILTLVLLLAVLTLPAGAEDQTSQGSCSLTIRLYDQESGTSLQDGTVTLYQVAVPNPNGEIGNYLAVESFAVLSELDQDDPPELARQLAEYALAQDLPGREGTPDGEGRIRFDALEDGVYLVVQTQPTQDYEPIAPFLVALPREQEGVWISDLEATPKVLQSIPQNPDTPAGDTLPQTGQLVWPILLLAGLGMICLCLGLPLSNRKHNGGRKFPSCS